MLRFLFPYSAFTLAEARLLRERESPKPPEELPMPRSDEGKPLTLEEFHQRTLEGLQYGKEQAERRLQDAKNLDKRYSWQGTDPAILHQMICNRCPKDYVPYSCRCRIPSLWVPMPDMMPFLHRGPEQTWNGNAWIYGGRGPTDWDFYRHVERYGIGPRAAGGIHYNRIPQRWYGPYAPPQPSFAPYRYPYFPPSAHAYPGQGGMTGPLQSPQQPLTRDQFGAMAQDAVLFGRKLPQSPVPGMSYNEWRAQRNAGIAGSGPGGFAEHTNARTGQQFTFKGPAEGGQGRNAERIERAFARRYPDFYENEDFQEYLEDLRERRPEALPWFLHYFEKLYLAYKPYIESKNPRWKQEAVRWWQGAQELLMKAYQDPRRKLLACNGYAGQLVNAVADNFVPSLEQAAELEKIGVGSPVGKGGAAREKGSENEEGKERVKPYTFAIDVTYPDDWVTITGPGGKKAQISPYEKGVRSIYEARDLTHLVGWGIKPEITYHARSVAGMRVPRQILLHFTKPGSFMITRGRESWKKEIRKTNDGELQEAQREPEELKRALRADIEIDFESLRRGIAYSGEEPELWVEVKTRAGKVVARLKVADAKASDGPFVLEKAGPALEKRYRLKIYYPGEADFVIDELEGRAGTAGGRVLRSRELRLPRHGGQKLPLNLRIRDYRPERIGHPFARSRKERLETHPGLREFKAGKKIYARFTKDGETVVQEGYFVEEGLEPRGGKAVRVFTVEVGPKREKITVEGEKNVWHAEEVAIGTRKIEDMISFLDRRDAFLEERRREGKALSREEFQDLFPGGPQLRQGRNFGDCYVIAALDALWHSHHFYELLSGSVWKGSKDGKEGYFVAVPLGSGKPLETIFVAKEEIDLPVGQVGIGGKPYLAVEGGDGWKLLERYYIKLYRKESFTKAEGGFSAFTLKELFIDGIEDQWVFPADFDRFFQEFTRAKDVATAARWGANVEVSAVIDDKLDEKFTILARHAYSIRFVDARTKMVVLANPHDTSKTFTLSFEEFKKAFEVIERGRIDFGKLFQPREKPPEEKKAHKEAAEREQNMLYLRKFVEAAKKRKVAKKDEFEFAHIFLVENKDSLKADSVLRRNLKALLDELLTLDGTDNAAKFQKLELLRSYKDFEK